MSNKNGMNTSNNIIIYQDENGITKVNVRFADEDVWLTQSQLAEIYDTTQENISMHVANIYKDQELDENRTYKKFLLVRQEGQRQVKRNIDHYNLDMIIALGYRIQSQVATRFRRWATQRLHEYIQKGFTMDDERLKQGGNRYFRELLQRIRDIRASERNFYQQVTDIYATSIDYDPRCVPNSSTTACVSEIGICASFQKRIGNKVNGWCILICILTNGNILIKLIAHDLHYTNPTSCQFYLIQAQHLYITRIEGQNEVKTPIVGIWTKVSTAYLHH